MKNRKKMLLRKKRISYKLFDMSVSLHINVTHVDSPRQTKQ